MSENGQKSAPAPAFGAAPTLKEPTPKEGLFFYHILAANTGKLEVDWDVVARASGYSNASTAKTRYSQIKRSIAAGTSTGTDASSSSATPAKTPTKPRGKKATVSADTDGTTNTTPSKVKKATTPRKKRTSAKEKKAMEEAAATLQIGTSGPEFEDEEMDEGGEMTD